MVTKENMYIPVKMEKKQVYIQKKIKNVKHLKYNVYKLNVDTV